MEATLPGPCAPAQVGQGRRTARGWDRHVRPAWPRFKKPKYPIEQFAPINPQDPTHTALFHELKHKPGVMSVGSKINVTRLTEEWSKEYARRLEAGTVGTLKDVREQHVRDYIMHVERLAAMQISAQQQSGGGQQLAAQGSGGAAAAAALPPPPLQQQQQQQPAMPSSGAVPPPSLQQEQRQQRQTTLGSGVLPPPRQQQQHPRGQGGKGRKKTCRGCRWAATADA